MNKSLSLTALLFLAGTLDAVPEAMVKSVILEGIIQESLQSKFSASVSSHPLLNLDDLTALSATVAETVLSTRSDEFRHFSVAIGKELGAQLTGKLVGRKFVIVSIYAINWCHRKLREGDLIDTKKHHNSIKYVQDVAGFIGSATGGAVGQRWYGA